MTVDGFYDFYGQRRPYSCDSPRHHDFYGQRPYHNHQSFQTRQPPQRIIRPSVASTPKVKSIPVQYVGGSTSSQSDSDPAFQYVGCSSRSVSKCDSAKKIQKVFRGFLVRKNVKKVKSIAKLVEEVEERIRIDVELIMRDSKERLKVQETLMKLLFQLDSISGVDSGVRICRKKVINKAIALQESVDSIAAVEKPVNVHDHDHDMSSAETDQMDDSVVDNAENQPEETDQMAAETDQMADSVVDNGENQAGETANKVDLNATPCESEAEMERADRSDNIKKSSDRELLESLVEENGRMMSLIIELFDKSQMQTQLLTSLSTRVGHLERGLAAERARRNKKTKKNTTKTSDGGR